MHKNFFLSITSLCIALLPVISIRSDSFDGNSEYDKLIKLTNEDVSIKSRDEVIKKISLRTLPSHHYSSHEIRQFGLHGMESPFATTKVPGEDINRAYLLLAKAGVGRFRTAESAWHRLSDNFSNYTELDFQVNHAKKYGMDFMFTVGYPPAKFNVSPTALSTFKPEYEFLFRQYLSQLLLRYKGIVKDVELGNEVDYPNTWWVGGTPKDYVRDLKILKEEARKVDPKIRVVAFAATASRTDKNGGPGGGRKFVREAFSQGIDRYADAYSMHYVWTLNAFPFTQFFRTVIPKSKISKPLIDSEDTGFARPSDIIKVFARSLFLFGYQRVDYFLARDYFDNGKLVYTGLFDINWHPKPRLLAYAASADAMRNRSLVGISEPAPGIEAYILKINPSHKAINTSLYSIVMWQSKNLTSTETYTPWTKAINVGNQYEKVSGIPSIAKAMDWRLNNIKHAPNQGFQVGLDPILVFCNQLPKWKFYSSKQWIEKRS